MITSHIINNIEYVGGQSSFNTNLAVGANYSVLNQTAVGDNGSAVLTVSGDSSVDTNTAGNYSVIYSAIDDDLVTHDVTENVIVAVQSSTDSFNDGSQDRYGNDTSGTVYQTLVQQAQAGNPPSAQSSALFDENALDPYEIGR